MFPTKEASFFTIGAMDQHYNPQIYVRLKTLLATDDFSQLTAYLEGLSNAHFRTAGYLLGERLLTTLSPERFWLLMRQLILWHPKAFVGTLAKTSAKRLQDGSISLDDEGFTTLAQALKGDSHVIDREKLMLQWLPVLTRYEWVERLFKAFDVPTTRGMEFLLRTDGLVAGFVLLRALRFEEHNTPLLVHACHTLMRRGDSLSFNVASAIRSFFDLQDVRGVFSLHIEPYELSRLDTDFDTFSRVVRKV